MSTVPFRSVPSAYRLPAGQFYTVYRSLADRPHLLVAGATGSGKSVVINGIITTMIMNASPFRCQFVLIDPKRVELAQYRSIPHVARYASEPGDMIAALEWSLTETDRRFRLMQSAGVKEYDGPDMYVIIDELADLMTTNKKSALPLLQRLAQIGRAARVHLIAASQNVLAITIPTVLKCNFSSILGLRTATRAQSRYLVDAEGCERLPDPKKEGVGYGFLRDGADLERLVLYKYDDGITASLISWWTSPACIAS